MDYIRQTVVKGVFNAGEMVRDSSSNLASTAHFTIVCAQCGEGRQVHVSERCPACASETTGRPLCEPVSTYFPPPAIGQHGRLWLISCTTCNFRAVARLS